MLRRHFCAGLAAGCLLPRPAFAQSSGGSGAERRALTLFAPAPEQGGWSGLARAIADGLRKDDVDSKLVYEPAGTDIGLPRFIRDFAGHGDTLMVSGLGMIGTALMGRLSASLDQLVPVARLTTEYLVVAVGPDEPYWTLADLTAALSTDPAAIRFCGGNRGTADHLLAAMIARRAGIDPRAVNYRHYVGGTGAVAATLDGSEAVVISGLSEVQPYLALGRLRALAISAPQRLPGIGAPTFIEQGMNIDFTNWRGVFAPPDLPTDDVRRLIALTDTMVSGAEWRAMLFRYNWMGDYLAGSAFAGFMREEIARVRTFLTELGM